VADNFYRAVPQIEFLSDGSVDVEKFVSQGEMAGEEALSELFDRFSRVREYC
jgi:hypothetical protein